jgi:hypothetical protein
MGRRSWATPEQLEYLKLFVPLLTHAKENTGLGILYSQVYVGFLKTWAPVPIVPTCGTSLTPKELLVEANTKLKQVSLVLNESSVHVLTPCQCIVNWYSQE